MKRNRASILESYLQISPFLPPKQTKKNFVPKDAQWVLMQKKISDFFHPSIKILIFCEYNWETLTSGQHSENQLASVPILIFSSIMPRDVSLSDSKCWNGGQKWVKATGDLVPNPPNKNFQENHFTKFSYSFFFSQKNCCN